MGRQYRPPRRGPDSPAGLAGMTHMPIVTPSVVTSSSTVIAIPNYGATDISTWAAGDYVLDAPAAGVVKTLFAVSSTSAARVIRAATDASVKIGLGGATQITNAASTVAFSVTMMGVNSTQWVVLSAFPVASTGAGVAIATS